MYLNSSKRERKERERKREREREKERENLFMEKKIMHILYLVVM